MNKEKHRNSGGPNLAHGLAWPAWPNGQSGLAGPCQEHSVGVVTTGCACVGQRGGAHAPDAVVAVRRWGSQVEHRWRRVGASGSS
jgi:hypothetical protein